MEQVYIIEDHPALREAVGSLIRTADGLELCGSCESAEAFLEQSPEQVDLLLIDVSLPGMNGIDLVRKLRGRRCNTPCVMLSGHSAGMYAEQARQAGAQAYVSKDDASELIPTLRLVLDGGSKFAK